MAKSIKQAYRVGIYAGTFDPVHVGHIGFALQAMKAARLDEVVFLPERLSRTKHPAEHYAHRVAMLQRALKPHPRMSVLELADKRFTVQRTWTHLRAIFAGTEIALLVGSDVLAHLPEWPHAASLLAEAELIVGTRADVESPLIRTIVAAWPNRPKDLHIIQSYSPHVSSTKVRRAMAERKPIVGLLASVRTYAADNWLYVSIKHAAKEKV